MTIDQDSRRREKESLQKQLSRYRRNLHILEEQKAMHGGMNVPLHIINQIDDSKEQIARLEGELEQFEPASEVQPASREEALQTEEPPPVTPISKAESAPPEGISFTIQGVEHKALPPGHILHNAFKIESFLAHGGMGAIYRGRQVRTGRAVAIKENFINSAEGVKQFLAEGKILAGLDKHLHLPLVYDYFTVEERQYLIMEFIEGQDLSDILKDEAGNRAPLPEATALDYIEQVCRAVRHLHERKEAVIHRDIKPKNIKITPQGKAVLVDFGLAKVGGAKTETEFGAQGISAGFAPPEQYHDRARTGPPSDIYALGATLYAILTATRPPDSMDILLGEEDLIPPAEINPALSDGVCQAVAWAMQILKKDRPQSVVAWVEALRGDGMPPPQPSDIATAKRPAKRERGQFSSLPLGGIEGGPNPNTRIWEKDGKAMVRIPAGVFLYGDEKVRKTLSEYWIDKTPVTNAEYARFVAETGHKSPEHWEDGKPPQDKLDHPVVFVFWDDASAYAKWAGKRLPSEVEWEKAARGTDGRIYPWGDEEPTKDLCNFDHNEGDTTQVGKYSPQGDSSYGCVDMSGNVWEWAASDYGKSSKVVRGGSWYNDDIYVRVANRNYGNPVNLSYTFGFRCAVSPGP